MTDVELTVKQAAKNLGITPRAVRPWAQRGTLAGRRSVWSESPRRAYRAAAARSSTSFSSCSVASEKLVAVSTTAPWAM